MTSAYPPPNKPKKRKRKPRGASRSGFAVVIAVVLVAVGGMWGAIAALGWGPQLGLDLRGGVSITLEPVEGAEVDDEVFDQTVEVLRNRVDGLGVAEPEIARQGDTVLVQMPGYTDLEQAAEVVGRTAQLQFRLVEDTIPPGTDEYDEAGPACGEEAVEGTPDADEDGVVLCEGTTDDEGEPIPPEQRSKFVLGPAQITGANINDAAAGLEQGITGGWHTQLELDSEAAGVFQEITSDLACDGGQFAIVLDGVVESSPGVAPTVQCGVGIPDGSAVISTGGQEEATELALVLRTGALPIELETQTLQSVSPTLGQASLDAGLEAGLIGLALVALYLVLLYRGMGVAATLELAMFGLVVFGLIIVLGNTMGFTLTLAGIAGIIVSVGISADSSVLFRERYRDEIRAGRSIRSAPDHAFTSAWRTNLTGNFVSLLAAGVLYALAVGPVRGFAFTFGLSTLVDTALFGTFTRGMFGLVSRTPALAQSKWMGLRPAEIAPEMVDETTGDDAQ